MMMCEVFAMGYVNLQEIWTKGSNHWGACVPKNARET